MANINFKNSELDPIPNDWEVKALGEITARITVGIANSATQAYTDNGIVMFRNQNIKQNYLDDTDLVCIDEVFESNYQNKRLKTGDLLIARTGYPGTTCVVPAKYENAQTFTTLIATPNKYVAESSFLAFYMNSPLGKMFFESAQIGGAQQNVNAHTLETMPIPLPPLPEQRRIAAALSDIDALIANLDALIDKKRLIKQATMQQLLSGKKRINGFCDKWVEYTIEDIAEYRRGSFPQPYGLSQWYGGPNAYPFVQVADVANEGFRLNNKTQQMISVLAQRMSVFVPKGTVLVTLQGSIGRVAITQYDSYVDRTLAIFENYKIKIDKSFFAYKLSETFYYEAQKAPGGIIKTITKDAFSSFSLLLPPSLAEQTAISKILSDMDEEISLLEAKKEKYTHLKQGMMSELLSGRIRI